MNASISSAALMLLLLASTGLLGQPPQRTARSRSIRDIVSELRRFHGEENRDSEVPPEVSRNLEALKHGLRDMIIQTLAEPNSATTEPNALATEVIEHLESEDVPVGDSGGYGVISNIEFRRPTEYPSWLVATTTVSIPYGEDTSLYVFDLKGGSWKYDLSQEADGYAEISGAQGWLTYRVATATPGGRPYLITADVSPSEASVWQALRLRILRVGVDPDHPVLLAKRTLSYCLDDAYYFSVHANGFGLIYLDYAVDPELAGYRSVHYLEYAVSAKGALVSRDIKIDPSNVIRKWVSWNWTAAQKSVDPSSTGGLQEWHQRFRAGGWTCGPGEASLSHRVADGEEQLLAVVDCSKRGDEKPSAFAVLRFGHFGLRIVTISGAKPSLPQGYETYFAGVEGVTNPVPVSTPQPRWPADVPEPARQVKLRMSAVVDEHGRVTDVGVLDWPDDQNKVIVPAIQALRKWEYKPGLRNGTPVNVQIEVVVAFEP
jgi:hypothetical protein